MAKLPQINRIRREDIPDAEDWIEKLLTPLNQFMEGVYQALNRGIAFNDNLEANLVDVVFTTDAAYATPTDFGSSVTFANPLKKRPVGVVIVSLVPYDNINLSIFAATSVSWRINYEGQIEIGYITGLAASTKYRAKLMVL